MSPGFSKNSGTQSVPELNDEINLMTLTSGGSYQIRCPLTDFFDYCASQVLATDDV